MSKLPKVTDAYALEGTDGVKALYRDWAQTYDMGFGEAEGYQLPKEVAHAFVAAHGEGPILDVGAGTGLVAEWLTRYQKGPIDALDLSEDMLSVAKGKNLYSDCFAADVTRPLRALGSRRYAGIVSAGTFTLGHVGAEGLDPLLQVASPGCVFAISVNEVHYAKSGFAKKLTDLGPTISDISKSTVRIYDDRAATEHREDEARIITFRKA